MTPHLTREDAAKLLAHCTVAAVAQRSLAITIARTFGSNPYGIPVLILTTFIGELIAQGFSPLTTRAVDALIAWFRNRKASKTVVTTP